MKKILILSLALVMLVVLLVACNNYTFTERDARPIAVVRSVPDGFILLSDAMYLISEVDEHVKFYVWKNQAGIIDWSRRKGSERHEYAFDTNIRDRSFVVSLADGSIYVNWQTFLDFLTMLEIQIDSD